jgi:HD-GYP domain-containing protein (c-di-GMP phosphodiesterase class II)
MNFYESSMSLDRKSRQKLRKSQILVGKPLAFDCYDEQGVLLFRKGLVIDSERTLERIIERGLFASLEQSALNTSQPASAGSKDFLIGTWSEENADAPPTPFQYFNDLNLRLKQLFTHINAQTTAKRETASLDFTEHVGRIADQVQLLCKIDADAAIGLLHLDQRNHYTIVHPLHRAIACHLVGKRHGFSEGESRRIICAALTCDVSTLDFQEQLNHQLAPLSPAQQTMLRNHPHDSARLLRELQVTDEDWITAVGQHHETLNEAGYPGRIPHNEVTAWSRLITLTDCYTAMITPRRYKQSFTSKHAMRTLFLTRGSIVDEHFTILFVKALGLYPPGTFVKLTNGETAIVIRSGKDSKAPLVKSVIGPRGAPLNTPYLRDTQVKEFAISDVVERDDKIEIDLHQLWDYTGRIEQ